MTLLILIVLAFIVAFFGWSLCRMAALSDRAHQEAFEDWRKEQRLEQWRESQRERV